MQRTRRLIVLFLVGGLTVTCATITVNIYFPAAEIRDAAAHIEQEVRQEEEKEPTSAPQSPQNSRLWPGSWHLRLALGYTTATAQAINLTITTPTIRRLIAARKQRYPHLVSLFNSGVLGENNRGFVDLRALDELSLRHRARAKTLYEQENRDRQELYQALAKANNIPAQRVSDIASIFADEHRQQARAGWWIQDDNSRWKRK
ncbi:hypothetical protein NKDENANG_02592 [Candidatus Entotheonellaceae bacterium PAL068K]